MGTTFSSVHIYSPTAIAESPDFRSFSEGWQTYVSGENPEDLYQFRAFAKKLSRKVCSPVLWFSVFDSETIWFEFYQAGKRVSAYEQGGQTGSKNLYGIPALIGYDEGQKRRLSRILSCADIDYQIALLEEYFGVCLLPVPELMNEGADVFRRVRSEEKYKALLEEDKMVAGKSAPIKAEMVEERKGKLFERRFDDDHVTFKPHCYLYGYANPGSCSLQPVRFAGGKLNPMTEEEFGRAETVPRADARKDERFTEAFGPAYKIHFTDKAPEGFRGKTLTTPRGFYFFSFDEQGRVLLSDERGGVAFVDTSLKVIAKMRLKGEHVDYADGHILTAGSNSFFVYAYHPRDAVRIYRIVCR